MNNLRADLAVARNRIDELTVKLDAAERSVTRAGLDDLLARVERGARAVERAKVVAWLRTRKDKLGQPNTKAERWADAIERGEHED